MHPCTATALRRAALVAAALAASLTAHAIADGHLMLSARAPFIWLGLIAMAVPCGAVRPVTTFRARSPLVMLGVLVGAQAVAHTLMSAAPWAFGLMVHQPASFGATAFIAHGIASLLLLGLLLAGDRILAAAVAAAQAIFSLTPPRRPRGAHPGFLVPCTALVPRPRPAVRSGGSRAPPR